MVHAPRGQQGEYQYPDLGYVCCPMSGPRVVAVGTAEDWKVYSLSSTTAEDGSANHSCMLQKGTTREYAEQSPLEYVGLVVPARLPSFCALALPGLTRALASPGGAAEPQPAHLTQAADHRATRTHGRAAKPALSAVESAGCVYNFTRTTDLALDFCVMRTCFPVRARPLHAAPACCCREQQAAVRIACAACCVLRAACCVLRAACCVLRAACCVLRAACCAGV
jgi:hypothetical protein